MSRRTINWGVLSTAAIATGKFIPALQRSGSSRVMAIASRDEERARATASALSIPKSYGSYEQLLADPEIDVIYNPLPNDMHVAWTIAAAAAGKHVLCEKPIAMTAEEARQLLACSHSVIVMEAFMVRYHPQWLRVRDLIRSGELGTVRVVQAAFSYFNTNPDNIRNKVEHGGRAMLDIGCYPITAARFFFECEPRRVVAAVERDERFGTDRQASVLADFGDGRQLSFVVSTQLAPFQRINVIGTRGRAEILIPFNAPQDRHTAITVDFGESLDGSLARREILASCDQYAELAEAMVQAILKDTRPAYGVEDAIKSMRVLDAVFQSERDNGWVEIGD